MKRGARRPFRWLSQPHPLHLVLGFALWLAWFALLYAAQGVGCAVAPPPAQQGAFTSINVLLGVGTLAFLAGFAAAALGGLARAAVGAGAGLGAAFGRVLLLLGVAMRSAVPFARP